MDLRAQLLGAELEIAHLHEKTDRLQSEMLEHFRRLEKARAAARG